MTISPIQGSKRVVYAVSKMQPFHLYYITGKLKNCQEENVCLFIRGTIATRMDQVAEIRSKIDIVSLIQEYLPLKKMGRNFKTLCPFHSEKTPSFIVSPERQIWHCFSCGKGGDVYTFLMEYEHMEFPEALRILANKAGVTLLHQQFETGVSSKKEKLYSLNRLACEFYHYLLVKHQLGKNAIAYVTEKRHIKPQTITTFQIGFAPAGNALVTYLMKKKGYKAEELLEAGLATRRGALLVDFFQNRLMFPLFDHRDNIIGFSGRILSDSIKTSKYINTRETLIYHKGATFFGMPTAKDQMKKEGKVYLMEGEFDVISSFQEGIANSLAVKGTAVTEDQVNLLSRFVQKVVLCFDMDKAGQDALKRSLGLLEKKSLSIGVLVLPVGKDPDEAIQKDKGGFIKAMKKDIPVYDYLLESYVKEYDPKTIEGKKKLGQELLPFFSAIDNEIVKEHYLTKLSETIGTSLESLMKEIERTQKITIAKNAPVITKTQRPRQEILEEYLLALFLQADNPKAFFTAIAYFHTSYVWSAPSLQKLFTSLRAFVNTHDTFDPKAFTTTLPSELLPAFDTSFLLPLSDNKEKYSEEIERVAKELHETSLKAEMKRLSSLIKQKEASEDTKGLEELQKEFSSLAAKLSIAG